MSNDAGKTLDQLQPDSPEALTADDLIPVLRQGAQQLEARRLGDLPPGPQGEPGQDGTNATVTADTRILNSTTVDDGSIFTNNVQRVTANNAAIASQTRFVMLYSINANNPVNLTITSDTAVYNNLTVLPYPQAYTLKITYPNASGGNSTDTYNMPAVAIFTSRNVVTGAPGKQGLTGPAGDGRLGWLLGNNSNTTIHAGLIGVYVDLTKTNRFMTVYNGTDSFTNISIGGILPDVLGGEEVFVLIDKNQLGGGIITKNISFFGNALVFNLQAGDGFMVRLINDGQGNEFMMVTQVGDNWGNTIPLRGTIYPFVRP